MTNDKKATAAHSGHEAPIAASNMIDLDYIERSPPTRHVSYNAQTRTSVLEAFAAELCLRPTLKLLSQRLIFEQSMVVLFQSWVIESSAPHLVRGRRGGPQLCTCTFVYIGEEETAEKSKHSAQIWPTCFQIVKYPGVDYTRMNRDELDLWVRIGKVDCMVVVGELSLAVTGQAADSRQRRLVLIKE